MKKKQSLSSGFQKLEKIVKKLEGGDLDLEEAAELYQEGLVLASFLKKRLEKVKNEIKEIEDESRE